MDHFTSLGVNRNELEQRAAAVHTELHRHRVRRTFKIPNVLYMPCEYKAGSEMPTVDDRFIPFGETDLWGGKRDRHAWFYCRAEVPDVEGRIEFSAETQCNGWDASNPQFILYMDGEIVQGLDVNHRSAVITARGTHDFFLYAYTGTDVDSLLFLRVRFLAIDEEVEALSYDVQTAREALALAKPGTVDYDRILTPLNAALSLLDLRDSGAAAFHDSVRAAREYLNRELYEKYPMDSVGNVACIGHTHIDLAWRWSYRQTIEKAQRSFATALALLDRYPAYKFTSSQVPLYLAVKREAPALYEKIRARVAEGRWETEGAMWVEADCNIPSGESLVRQFLYGKRFFREEFGKESRVLWLPDVFGYSAALPQILQKSGVDTFITSKISWNDTNTMPNDTFLWRGIDGSEVLTHFITAQRAEDGDPQRHTTYVMGRANPSMMKGTFDRYQQKYCNDEALATVGYGDGGGGTTPDAIEQIARMEAGLPGIPKTVFRTVGEHLDILRRNVAAYGTLPRWVGELYLEYHRGTYTSQANNKKNNRKSEFLLQNTETLGVTGALLGTSTYPREGLRNAWETVLLNQFHDILPGSSIREVYETTDREYAEITAFSEGEERKALEGIAARVGEAGTLVYNPTCYPFTGGVETPEGRIFVRDIPPFGYRVVQPEKRVKKVKTTANGMENEWFSLQFDANGDLTSVYDKRAKRELLKAGETVRYRAYEDLNVKYDAWEISHYIKEKSYAVNASSTGVFTEEGDRTGYRVTREFGKSRVVGTVYLYDNEPRVDFEDALDWQTEHVLLKREFPLDLLADRATCEIQFGSVERPTHANTSWDAAKYEVCAHKYVDISESDYGVALLNDCKFGHSLADNVIGISLLKCPTEPDPDCDKGHHEIRYSLYPHAGAARASDVAATAYAFNRPCLTVPAAGNGTGLAASWSLLSCDCPHVNVETVKFAEDSDDIVVRLFETNGARAEATLSFGVPIRAAEACDLLEGAGTPLPMEENRLTLSLKPFEIVTLKLKR